MKHKKLLFFIAAGLVTGAANGQALVNGRLEMTNANGNERRLSNLGTPVDTADAVNAVSIQQSRLTYATSTGTANSLFVNIPGIGSGYRAGAIVSFRANANNTGAVTLNVNGWGPRNVYFNANTPLIAGDILPGQIISVIFDGANFQCISPLAQQHEFSGQLQGDVIGGQHSTLITNGSVTTLKLADSAATALKIKTAAVNTVHLADSAATSIKIKGRAVNTVHLADSAVTARQIKTASVGNVHFADSAVTAIKIKSASVGNVHLIDSVATAPKIKTAAVQTNHMLDSVAIGSKVKTGAVNTVHITDNAVNSAKIADGTIANADVNGTAAIAYNKLALAGSVTNADVNAAAGIAYSKLLLANNVTNSDVSGTAGIAYSKLALAGSVTNADISGTAAVAYNKLNLANTIQSGDLMTASVTPAKISTAGTTNGQVLTVSGSAAAWVTPGGSVTSLNGATGSSQTITTGTAGSNFDIATAGNTHTVNLPSASASARGAVTTGPQTFAGDKTFNNSVAVPTGDFHVGATANFYVAGINGNTKNVGKLAVGTPASGSTATALEVNSTTGVFALPRVSSLDRDLIASPVAGSMIYNTTTNAMQVYIPAMVVAEQSDFDGGRGLNSTQSKGQTFTPTGSGKISTILAGFNVVTTPGIVTATVYDGVGGTSLGSTTVNVTASGWHTFNFASENISLTAGSIYYVEFTTTTFEGAMFRITDGSTYSGGTMYEDGLPLTFDARFQVNIAAAWNDL